MFSYMHFNFILGEDERAMLSFYSREKRKALVFFTALGQVHTEQIFSASKTRDALLIKKNLIHLPECLLRSCQIKRCLGALILSQGWILMQLRFNICHLLKFILMTHYVFGVQRHSFICISYVFFIEKLCGGIILNCEKIVQWLGNVILFHIWMLQIEHLSLVLKNCKTCWNLNFCFTNQKL